MPVPALVGPILAALGPWITRFFMAKAVVMVVGFLGRLGLVMATNEFAMEPLIEHVTTMWMQIPAAWQCWFALFGVTKAAGICVSGLTLISAKKVFFAKAPA